jgi:hypothetical protein
MGPELAMMCRELVVIWFMGPELAMMCRELVVNRKPEMGNAPSKIPVLLGVWVTGVRHSSCY